MRPSTRDATLRFLCRVQTRQETHDGLVTRRAVFLTRSTSKHRARETRVQYCPKPRRTMASQEYRGVGVMTAAKRGEEDDLRILTEGDQRASGAPAR